MKARTIMTIALMMLTVIVILAVQGIVGGE